MKLFGNVEINQSLVDTLKLLGLDVLAATEGVNDWEEAQVTYLCRSYIGKKFRVINSEVFDWGDVFVPSNEWKRVPASVKRSFRNDRIYCAVRDYEWLPNKSW